MSESWISVEIDAGCSVRKTDVSEFVELFYPGCLPGQIIVSIVNSRGKKGRRGVCETMGRSHHISVFWKTITSSIADDGKITCGGNVTTTENPRLACFMTLAHELRHAFQFETHMTKEKFFNKRGYSSRPCEVDARRYVDESYVEICGFLDIQPDQSIKADKTREPDSSEELLEDLIGILLECDVVSVDDLKFELAAIGLNNPISLGVIIHELVAEGVVVNRS